MRDPPKVLELPGVVARLERIETGDFVACHDDEGRARANLLRRDREVRAPMLQQVFCISQWDFAASANALNSSAWLSLARRISIRV
jgi:hypothetical protein